MTLKGTTGIATTFDQDHNGTTFCRSVKKLDKF